MIADDHYMSYNILGLPAELVFAMKQVEIIFCIIFMCVYDGNHENYAMRNKSL